MRYLFTTILLGIVFFGNAQPTFEKFYLNDILNRGNNKFGSIIQLQNGGYILSSIGGGQVKLDPSGNPVADRRYPALELFSLHSKNGTYSGQLGGGEVVVWGEFPSQSLPIGYIKYNQGPGLPLINSQLLYFTNASLTDLSVVDVCNTSDGGMAMIGVVRIDRSDFTALWKMDALGNITYLKLIYGTSGPFVLYANIYL